MRSIPKLREKRTWAFASRTKRTDGSPGRQDGRVPGPHDYNPQDHWTSSHTRPHAGLSWAPEPPPKQNAKGKSSDHTSRYGRRVAKATGRGSMSHASEDLQQGTGGSIELKLTDESDRADQSVRPTSAFASTTPREPERLWLNTINNSDVHCYSSMCHKEWGAGISSTRGVQWSKSKSPRMMAYDPIRGEQGTYFQVESIHDPDSIASSSQSTTKESWPAFRPGKVQNIRSLHPKIGLRGPTGSTQLSERLGPQHATFDAVTCNTQSEWESLVTKNITTRNASSTRTGQLAPKPDSIFPEWLKAKMPNRAGETFRIPAKESVDSRKVKKTLSKLFSAEAEKQAELDLQKTVLTLFGIAPHKRVAEDIRIGAMWLRDTDLGSSLPPLARQNVTRGAKLLKVRSGTILSAEVITRNIVEPPPNVYIVLAGILIQRCKARSFQRFLMKGDSACELPLLEPTQFGNDIVTVAGGPSGATVVAIPKQLFVDVARVHRLRVLQNRINILQSSALFEGMSKNQLARLGLALKVKKFSSGGSVLKQGKSVPALYVVSSGEFSCGRSIQQYGENKYPLSGGIEKNRDGRLRKRTRWVRMKRTLLPITTVGRKTRGQFFGEESLFSSFLAVLGSEKKKDVLSSEHTSEKGSNVEGSSWSSVICSSTGEIYEITCPVLKMLGKKLFHQVVHRVADVVAKRPKDSTLMRRLVLRQEIQHLKCQLIQKSCTL